MKKDGCKSQIEAETGVTVKVDVAKIVKYVCIAGVLIVAIIFGTKCFSNMFITTEAKS